jgi:long-chain acyl-CoA synthetase
MNLARLLTRSAALHANRPAIALGTRIVCDYRGFALRASALAASLVGSLALRRADRVAVFATNDSHYLEILYGAWIAGLAVVPINCKLHPKEVAFILEDSGAAALFASGDVGSALQPLLPGIASLRHAIDVGSDDYARLVGDAGMVPVDVEPDDLAWLFYTSGTTGRPKGVMLTHRNLLTTTLCYFADVDHAQATDACLYAAPMSHGAGLYNFAQVVAGARHVVPESRGFDADEFFALAAAHGDATTFAAPTMVKRLVDHAESTGRPGDAIRTIVYGGAPMYAADILHALHVLGDRFVQIYGQGESPMTISALSRAQLGDRSHPRYAARIASVGVAQSAVEVRVADETGRTLPAGATGEILVRGDSVMRGYWRNPEATAQTLRDGWLHTGDVGELDDDGFLTLKDRSKDVIISGGSNIYPREIEEVLLRHAGVQEACVIGRPHADWGEEVVAFVVRRPGALVDAAALDALCLDNIARFKRPKLYRFVTELPKNNYGKVLKRELRDGLGSERSSAQPASPVK